MGKLKLIRLNLQIQRLLGCLDNLKHCRPSWIAVISIPAWLSSLANHAALFLIDGLARIGKLGRPPPGPSNNRPIWLVTSGHAPIARLFIEKDDMMGLHGH